ncbi:MAG: hypothetical protein V1824_03430 [archaeon]
MQEINSREISGTINNLKEFINSKDEKILIQAGHFRLGYNKDKIIEAKLDENDKDGFGVFSKLTFNLGCELLKFAKEQNKNAKLSIFVDDWSYKLHKKFNSREIEEWNRKTKDWFKEINGHLLDFHKITLYTYNLNEGDILEDNVVLENRNNKKRNFGKYISEQRLRNRHDRINSVCSNFRAGCSEEYNQWLADKLNEFQNFSLISFVPEVCRPSVEFAIKDLPKDKHRHIFLPTNIYR